ncbi:MAG TPA: hypothetical protein VNT03_09355 [Baekduia sp.]|nr:hypothetical protein [Baekduia sp.]
MAYLAELPVLFDGAVGVGEVLRDDDGDEGSASTATDAETVAGHGAMAA